MTTVFLITFAAALVAAIVAWRRRERLMAVGLSVAALVVAYLVSWLFIALIALVCGALVYHQRGRSSWLVNRWGNRSRRKHGVASSWDIFRHASWLVMRRKAGTVRPSVSGLSRGQRAKMRTKEFAVPLCRSGFLRVWSSVEDVVLTFGRPRSGKTQWLIHQVIDAPGAVLVTSTRTDIYDTTSGLRSRSDRPVFVFNPTGLGDLPSTVSFDPLSGCADPSTAYERATDLLAAGPSGGADHAPWKAQACRVLTALLHAAALGGLSMHEVAQWVADPTAHHRQVLSLLRRSPSAAAYVSDAEQFLGTNDRTRSSITSTIMPTFGWLASPTACAAATGATPFDVAELLRARGTVYLLGGEESQVAPLLSALTGHIAREARRLAAREPGGRLDPPLTLALDEAALICPVPLDSWTSDMGGRGVHIIAAFQSRAQLASRWGDAAARVILNNAGALVVFSLGADTDDLGHWAKLAGERDERVPNFDAQHRVVSHATRRVPVVSPAQLTNLPPGRVVVFRRGVPVVMGRTRPAWKRWDVRAQARLTRRASQAVVTAAEQVTQAAQPAGASNPVPSQRWVVDAHGITQSPNGQRPAGGQATQEAGDVAH